MWQAQHPLSNRYVRKYVIDEMGGPFGHSASTTPGAEAATLAGEGDEAIQAAGATPESGEAASQTAALQKVVKLLLHEARQPLAVPQARGVRTERLEMLPNDLVQEGGRRIARFVNSRWQRHAPSTGASRANDSTASNRPGIDAVAASRCQARQPWLLAF
jgi:hypothetical protein